MLLNLYIGGVDYIDKILKVPFIDESTPEFGNLEGLLNDIIEVQLQIKYLQHFNIQQDMEVLYLRNNTVIFNGKVNKISYNEKYITLQCKSNTSILFNKHIRENEIMSPYVADNMYPADIIKEMLELVGLKMNYTSYINALQYHQQLEVTLSCTNENWITSEILNKIAEVTCARIYLYNDEFHYEPFGMYETPPYLDIKSRYWVDYPFIEQFEKYDEEYGGTEVKIGESVSYTISNERLPEKTIDLSISPTNGVYTDSATTAMHIVDLYDKYLSQKKYKLTGSLKLSSIGQYINKGSFIRWNGRIYAIVNIQNQSYIKKDIEAIGIDYYNIDVKNLFIQGGILTVALNHNALDGLQGGTTGQYYHLTQDLLNNITFLTDGSNADSLHKHHLSAMDGTLADIDGTLADIDGTLDDIDDGTTYGKVKNSQTGNITNSSGDLSTNVDDSTIQNNGSNQLEVIESGINLSNVSGDLDDIDDGSTYGKVKKSQSNEIDFSGGDLSFTNDAKTDIANPYLTEYVLPEGQMNDHAKDNTIVQNNQARPVFGSKVYRVDTSVVETGVRWQSDLIPVRTDETLEFIISDTSHNNGSGEDIRIVLAERDKDYNYYNSKSETVSATDNSIRVSFTTSSSTVRYVYFRIYASETSAWGANSFWKFTNPIIRRKSKHGTEYTFRAKWTGDLQAETDAGTPEDSYTILENTDNKLIELRADTETNLDIKFEDGFLNENDYVDVSLGDLPLLTVGSIYGTIPYNVYLVKIQKNYFPNRLDIFAYKYDNTPIHMSGDIGSNENFVEVIIRKRG